MELETPFLLPLSSTKSIRYVFHYLSTSTFVDLRACMRALIIFLPVNRVGRRSAALALMPVLVTSLVHPLMFVEWLTCMLILLFLAWYEAICKDTELNFVGA